MTKQKAKEWMDVQVLAEECRRQTIGDICICGLAGKEIHVYRGLRRLAHALGLPFSIHFRDNADFPVKLTMEYGGYEFFQLEAIYGEDDVQPEKAKDDTAIYYT